MIVYIVDNRQFMRYGSKHAGVPMRTGWSENEELWRHRNAEKEWYLYDEIDVEVTDEQ